MGIDPLWLIFGFIIPSYRSVIKFYQNKKSYGELKQICIAACYFPFHLIFGIFSNFIVSTVDFMFVIFLVVSTLTDYAFIDIFFRPIQGFILSFPLLADFIHGFNLTFKRN